MIDTICEVDKIVLVDVEERLLNIFELLLVIDDKVGIVHEVIRLSICIRIFLVFDIERFALEEMVEKPLLLFLKLFQRLVNFRVDLLLGLLLRFRLELDVGVVRRIRGLHTFKYI